MNVLRLCRSMPLVLALLGGACGDGAEPSDERVALTVALTWTLEGEAAGTDVCPTGSSVNIGTCAAPVPSPDSALGAPRACSVGTSDFNIFVPLGDNCLVARMTDRTGVVLYEEPVAITVLVAGQRAERAVDFDVSGDGGRPGGGTIIGDAGNDTSADATIDSSTEPEVDAGTDDTVDEADGGDTTAMPAANLVECICGDGAAVLEDCVVELCTRTGEAPAGACETLCGERGFSNSTCYRSAPACR